MCFISFKEKKLNYDNIKKIMGYKLKNIQELQSVLKKQVLQLKVKVPIEIIS